MELIANEADLLMERPSYVAALSVPSLRQQMVEVREMADIGHMADVLIEKYLRRCFG
jgi:hypothetical protein